MDEFKKQQLQCNYTSGLKHNHAFTVNLYSRRNCYYTAF